MKGSGADYPQGEGEAGYGGTERSTAVFEGWRAWWGMCEAKVGKKGEGGMNDA